MQKTSVSKSRSAKVSLASGAATMQMVADIAGVSAMTVSRALKDDALVSKATRDRILAAVDQTGYVPDATARMFATRRTGFVAVLVPSLNNSNFADTVRGSSEVLDAAGLQMLLGDTEYTLSREESLVTAVLQRRPEAVILTGGNHTARARKMLAEAKIPLVETWEIPKEPLGHLVGFSKSRSRRGDGSLLVSTRPPADRLHRRRGECRYARIGTSHRLSTSRPRTVFAQ